MIADTHIHTADFSADAKMRSFELRDYVLAHTDVICCTTEHYDYGYPVPANQLICDIDRYYEAYIKAGNEFKNQYSIPYPVLFGIEYNFIDHLADYYTALSDRYPFDSVICSVHLLDGTDPYYNREVFDAGRMKIYSSYLESIVDSLQDCRYFDIVGHFDYLSRYSGYPDAKIRYRDFSAYFDEIFRLAVKNSKAIEFNTSTSSVFQGLGYEDYLPDPDIFKRYRELGGELVTYGSDAHNVDHILRLSAQAAGLLRGAGFEYLTYYKDRKPVLYKIDEM
ncbi:MAG: histidinol-phosphatase HisJ family protein [Saccharofermentanales bacterium]